MQTFFVKLSSADDVKHFVHIVNTAPYNIDLVDGNYRVDAKSIMGIFSCQLGKALCCEAFSDDCQKLLNDLKPYLFEQ